MGFLRDFPAVIPTPTVVDTIVGYAAGARLGVDAGLATWEGNGLIGSAGGYIAALPAANAHWVGACALAGWEHDDQWAAGQSIVPIDQLGSSIGVRVDPATGYGYFLGLEWLTDYQGANAAYVLTRRGPGGDASLGFFACNDDNDSEQFGGIISDGVFVMLEVYGQNPVRLRASMICTKASGTGAFANTLTVLPGEVPTSTGTVNNGGPAARVLFTVADSSASRILSGAPGMARTGPGPGAAAESMYGFNAGPIYSLTASAGPVSGGVATISGIRYPGTTVTVT